MPSADLINKVSISFGSFKVIVENPLFWAGGVVILLFLLIRWGIRKFLSFSIVIAALLFSMFKVDSYIVSIFGKEEGSFYTVLTKPLFLFLIAFVVIYYGFIWKD